MGLHYDRQGRPCSMRRWQELVGGENRVIAQTRFANGILVSTVYLGLIHGEDSSGRPLIFETMVFHPSTGSQDQACRRYASELEAKAGHLAMVAEWQDVDPLG